MMRGHRDDAPAVLASGLSRLVAQQQGIDVRKALPNVLALSQALRTPEVARGALPEAELLLDAMHESWDHLDEPTRSAFKVCLRRAAFPADDPETRPSH